MFEDSLNYLNTLDPGYASTGVSDASINPHNPNRRGKGGVALLWKKSILATSIVIQDEDRIIGISLKSNSGSIFYIFAVYLPSTNHTINEFTEYVDKLYNLYLEYSSLGTVIFLGDINAEISGTRYNARPGNRQQIMNDFLVTTGLYSPVSDTICKGPLNTFSPYESGLNRSLIDHILVDHSKSDLIQNCNILDDHYLNVSDHLPVIVTMKSIPTFSGNSTLTSKCGTKWNNLSPLEIKKCYTQNLKFKLDSVSLCTKETNSTTLDDKCKLLIKVCKDTSNIYLPKTKYNAYLKPKWKEKLRPLYMSMGHARRLWVKDGRPRGNEYHTYVNYKRAKCNFRRELRLLLSEREREIHEQVDQNLDVDINQFWKFIKRKRSNKYSCLSEIKFDTNNILRDPIEIAEGWASYFEDLYTCKQNPIFDAEHYDMINNRVTTFLMEYKDKFNDILDRDIEMSEVARACQTLPNGKATGHDGLSNEHLKYGGLTLFAHLSCIFTSMLHIGHVPAELKKGIIITILKDRHKSLSSPNNYRGITLLPVFYKLLERILLARIQKYISLNSIRFPDQLQFAYQPKLSSLHASFTLQEAINYNLELGSKVYTCLLDTSKAFDIVWI